ncbi:MAG: peptidyl-prolyl cis-trans isomerase [Proteobacteria bacterium]|nr:peptidyl-prolyl cis-trans isomerase [Pseudomonadota bacterium]
MKTEHATQQSIGWLVSGLVLGLLGVLVSVITPSWDVPGDSSVVAVVNDTAITRAKYLSYLEALASDKKDPIGAEDSRYVLQRIIEEELLVQRGVEVGLLESDKRTRAALVNGMISMTTTAAEAKAPSEGELAEFFEENIDYFTPTARLRARQLIVKGEDAEQRAGEAYRLLAAGELFQRVESEFGSVVALIVPDSLLPPAKLREYLGPTLTQMLLEQPAGFVSAPQPVGSGFRIVQLFDKAVGKAPAMEDIREQVEAEYLRRSGDRALREYLEWLKDRADISYPSELPL